MMQWNEYRSTDYCGTECLRSLQVAIDREDKIVNFQARCQASFTFKEARQVLESILSALNVADE